MRRTTIVLAALILASIIAPPTIARSSQPRQLTFEDRVRAHEAIERVYRSHQLGASSSFEETMPRAVLEQKVQTYLKQSAALEWFWQTPVTAEMLEAEVERMVHGTRMGSRLRELFAALDHDPILIQECLARAALVDRLTRNFYAFDSSFHSQARLEAETMVQALEASSLAAWQADPRRVETVFARYPGDEPPVFPSLQDDPQRTVSLEPAVFDTWRSRLLEPPRVEEDRDSLYLRFLLEGDENQLRVATWRWSKVSWDDWWRSVESGLDESSITTVARLSNDSVLPAELQDTFEPESLAEADDSWDNGSLDDLPDPAGSNTAVWTGSRMIVWGGATASGYSQSGYLYDPSTDAWTPISVTGAPSARRSHSAVWTGTRMVIWGGYNGFSHLASGGQYDPLTNLWTTTSTSGAPSARSQHTAVWSGSEMVVWGGSNEARLQDPPAYLGSGGRYDPVADRWTATSLSGSPSARLHHTAVWTGSRMAIWGGRSGNALNTGGLYDPLTNSWSVISTGGAPSVRMDHTAVWTGGRMVIWGGFDGMSSELATGGIYDPVSNAWTATSTTGAPAARRMHTAVWTGTRMVVWGGFGYMLAGGVYDPVADAWTATSTAAAPYGRERPLAVWTGRLMLVWGGAITNANTGGRYDPASDAWTPISPGGAPSARRAHEAVWTGNVMIVWGGYDDIAPSLDTGGRYDPAIDAWTPTSLAGAPARRVGHTAVWTGERMLVWGGVSVGIGFPESGGLYDPGTDTWTPTAVAGAPAPRLDHSAVWTGSRMIVWGGRTSDASLQTGGQYDPEADAWTSTSTVSAPSARYDHTAVWTGTTMVVWGGRGAGYLLTGGRYDPVDDTWTPTSTSGAPSPRSFHTAVWTGSRMIVWGGYGGSYLASGAQYNPANDAWSPTSVYFSILAPVANHSAIWTGNRMVVWGGYQGTIQLRVGARYNPDTNTWTAANLAGAPSPRQAHTAIWTGSRMIIWGGFGPSGPSTIQTMNLQTGGQYILAVQNPNRPPLASAGPDQRKECHSFLRTSVTLDATGSSDPDGDSLMYLWSAPGILFDHPTSTVATATFPLGTTVVTLTVSDGEFTATDVVAVTIVDTTAPDVAISPSPSILWPPNHRLVPVALNVSVQDNCDSSPSTSVLVTSSEPDDAYGGGDGHTKKDVQGINPGPAPTEVLLRAERDASGTGRFYSIAYQAIDRSLNTGVAVSVVEVPHDMAGITEPLTLDLTETMEGQSPQFEIKWTPVQGALSYNILRGNLSHLTEAGSLAVIGGPVQMVCNLTEGCYSGLIVAEEPEQGECFFYLMEYFDGGYSGFGSEAGGRDVVVTAPNGCQ